MFDLNYRDCSEKTFWYVGNDNTNQEDDGIEPVVAEDEGYDEEGNTEEDGHSCDQMNEVVNLASDRRLTHLQSRGKVGNATHDSSVASVDDHSTCST